MLRLRSSVSRPRYGVTCIIVYIAKHALLCDRRADPRVNEHFRFSSLSSLSALPRTTRRCYRRTSMRVRSYVIAPLVLARFLAKQPDAVNEDIVLSIHPRAVREQSVPDRRKRGELEVWINSGELAENREIFAKTRRSVK